MTQGSHAATRSSLRPWIADWIGIDPRALAAFRIGLATILLVDLAIRATDLTAFYADGGFFPFEAARRWHGSRWSWSLHLLDGSPSFQAALLLLAAVLAIALLLGYRTTLAAIGSWVLLASLHNRVPMLLNGGDILFRMLLFWGMFLPLGREWSIDARRRRQCAPGGGDSLTGPGRTERHDRCQPVVSIASAALLLQMCLMYWFTGQFKFNSDWLSGDSMYYVFSFDAYGRPLGRFLLNFPTVCKLMTWGALWLELVGPWLVMLPTPWLARLAEDPRVVGRTPRWLRRVMYDVGRYLRLVVVLAFLGLHLGIELTMTVGLFSYVSAVGWLVFVPREVWQAIGRWLSRLLVIRSPVDKALAAQPTASAWTLPQLLHVSALGARQLACLVLLVYVVWWNVATLQTKADFEKVLPRPLQKPAHFLLVGQKWSMFSRPTKDDGWFVARAVTADAGAIDILRGGAPVDLAKPADVAGIFPNHRWRKFYRQLIPEKSAKYRAAVAEHLGRTWNRTHRGDQRAVEVELLYLRERTVRDPAKISVERIELVRVELEPPRPDPPSSEAAEELAAHP